VVTLAGFGDTVIDVSVGGSWDTLTVALPETEPLDAVTVKAPACGPAV
jgi:hypothetical protein